MKTLYTKLAFAIGSVLLSLGSYAQTTQDGTLTQQPQPARPDAQQTMPPANDMNQESQLSSEDQSFLEKAVHGSYAEIEGSQLAVEKSESQDVKEFAQTMITDHNKMVEDATSLAASKGMTPPDQPSVIQRTEITALKALSGGPFDTMYVNRIGVAAHEKTVELFEEASQNAQDPDVKALATEALPKLREHLQMAQALDAKQKRE